MMSRKQTMKYSLAQIHEAFRTLNDSMSGRPAEARAAKGSAHGRRGGVAMQGSSADGAPAASRAADSLRTAANAAARKTSNVASPTSKQALHDDPFADDDSEVAMTDAAAEGIDKHGPEADGFIHADALVRALTTTGTNPLDEAEAREYVAFMNPDAEGKVNWMRWVEKFLSNS